MATLLARRVLPERVVIEATQVLNDARGRLREQGGVIEGEGEGQRKKVTGGCCVKCGEPVPVCGMVVCGVKVWSLPLFYYLKIGRASCRERV